MALQPDAGRLQQRDVVDVVVRDFDAMPARPRIAVALGVELIESAPRRLDGIDVLQIRAMACFVALEQNFQTLRPDVVVEPVVLLEASLETVVSPPALSTAVTL